MDIIIKFAHGLIMRLFNQQFVLSQMLNYLKKKIELATIKARNLQLGTPTPGIHERCTACVDVPTVPWMTVVDWRWKEKGISSDTCVDHYVLLFKHLSNHAFNNKRLQTLFKDQLDRSKAIGTNTKMQSLAQNSLVTSSSKSSVPKIVSATRRYTIFARYT